MIHERKILAIEFIVVILLWIFVIITPLLLVDDFDQDWITVHIMWAEYAVVGFAFLLNRLVLMPRLFFAKKYIKYALSLATLFLLLGLFVIRFDGINKTLSLFGIEAVDPQSPRAMDGNTPRPLSYRDEIARRDEYPRYEDDSLRDGEYSRPPRRRGVMRPTSSPHSLSIFPPSFSLLFLAMIVIALDMGLSIAVKWLISEQKQAHSEKERVSAQLSNLQSQVSPHFFMNTLNNIHALVDLDSKRAKQTIIELSSLMDYLLYDSSTQESVSLQKELDFICSYVNLMRLRYSNTVNIELIYGNNVPVVQVPPLLFLNFIENSFKYGIDYEHDSFIKIEFDFNEKFIEMRAKNSNHSKLVNSQRHGLGISNACKRLELLYGDNYTLDIDEKESTFNVNLKIPTL
ncbi:MAG: histidine kinase [Rikenellaceae bacterium]